MNYFSQNQKEDLRNFLREFSEILSKMNPSFLPKSVLKTYQTEKDSIEKGAKLFYILKEFQVLINTHKEKS